MKQGMTIEALTDEVARIASTKQDYVVDTRNVWMQSDTGGSSQLVVEGIPETLAVLDHAHGQVSTALKIPKVYYDRLRGQHPALLDENVNTLLHANGGTRQMLRSIDGRCRAFLSDRYRRLDNYDLMLHVVPALEEVIGTSPTAYVESSGLTDTKLWLTVIFPMWESEVKVGQPVKLGVRIANSEVGASRCSVETILYVLTCKNGMTTGHELKRTHIGKRVEADEDLAIYRDETLALDDAAFFAKVGDAVRACASEARFQQIVGEMRDLAGVEIDHDPPKAIEVLSNKVGLTEAEASGVLRHLIAGGDLSGWGYVNAVTRAAQDVDSYDRSMELERIGGRLAYGELVEALT